jgi:hypothetical protein
MIKYRPHRGGLQESMAEMQEFGTVDEMKQHVADDVKTIPGGESVTADDVSWSEDYGEDPRIGWEHWRYVMVNFQDGVEWVWGMMDYEGEPKNSENT